MRANLLPENRGDYRRRHRKRNQCRKVFGGRRGGGTVLIYPAGIVPKQVAVYGIASISLPVHPRMHRGLLPVLGLTTFYKTIKSNLTHSLFTQKDKAPFFQRKIGPLGLQLKNYLFFIPTPPVRLPEVWLWPAAPSEKPHPVLASGHPRSKDDLRRRCRKVFHSPADKAG
jgi:hypothetical protein